MSESRRLLLPVLAAVLAAAGCAGSGEAADARSRSPEAVLGAVWEWVGTTTPDGRLEVAQPERYTLQLLPDRRAQLRLDCNRGAGSYEIAEGRLSFGPLMSTRMACPPDSLDARYSRELGQVESFHVEGGRLYLHLAGEAGTMRFRASSGEAP